MKHICLYPFVLLSILIVTGLTIITLNSAHAAVTSVYINQNGSQTALRFQTVQQAINQSSPQNPLIFSHRGSMLQYPEHSFAGYDAAINAGSAFIEQDVWLSKDGQLYVSHDNNLSATTGNNVTITSSTSRQLSVIRLRNGEKLHTLAALFQRYGNHVHYVIEAQHNSQLQDLKTQAALITLLKKTQLVNNVIIQDTYLNGLVQVHKTTGFTKVPTLWLAPGTDTEQLITDVNKAPAWVTYFAFPAWNQTTTLMTAIRNRHIRPAIWTISSQARINQAAKFQPDAIFTNLTPATLRELSHSTLAIPTQIVKVNYKPGYSIQVWNRNLQRAKDNAGHIKKLKTGTRWKIRGDALIKGHFYYNLGNNQWLDSSYATLK